MHVNFQCKKCGCTKLVETGSYEREITEIDFVKPTYGSLIIFPHDIKYTCPDCAATVPARNPQELMTLLRENDQLTTNLAAPLNFKCPECLGSRLQEVGAYAKEIIGIKDGRVIYKTKSKIPHTKYYQCVACETTVYARNDAELKKLLEKTSNTP